MINVSSLYCKKYGRSHHLRYSSDDSMGPVVAYNCTSQCNLNCFHCYSSAGPESDFELDTEAAKKLITQAAELNVPAILFSGGEPLMRKDIFELISFTVDSNISAVLSTNGTFLDKKAAKDLKNTGLKYVGISVDGPQDIHDHFRQTPGAFKEALRAFEACNSQKIRIGIRFTITSQNFRYVPFVFKLASEYGISRICFYHLVNSGRAQQNTLSPTADQVRHSIDQILDLTRQNIDTIEEVLTVGNRADGPYILQKLKKEGNSNYDFSAGLLLKNIQSRNKRKIICVDHSGNVYPDQFRRKFTLGNINQNSLMKILDIANYKTSDFLHNKQEYSENMCGCCKWFEYCGGNNVYPVEGGYGQDRLNEPACYLNENEIY